MKIVRGYLHLFFFCKTDYYYLSGSSFTNMFGFSFPTTCKLIAYHSIFNDQKMV